MAPFLAILIAVLAGVSSGYLASSVLRSIGVDEVFALFVNVLVSGIVAYVVAGALVS